MLLIAVLLIAWRRRLQNHSEESRRSYTGHREAKRQSRVVPYASHKGKCRGVVGGEAYDITAQDPFPLFPPYDITGVPPHPFQPQLREGARAHDSGRSLLTCHSRNRFDASRTAWISKSEPGLLWTCSLSKYVDTTTSLHLEPRVVCKLQACDSAPTCYDSKIAQSC